MSEQTIRRINVASFVTSLTAIILGVIIGILGVWGIVTSEHAFVWKLLLSDGLVFAGAVLTNLAIACYKKPGGGAD